MLNGGAISWKSRQDSVSLSTSETEIIAASQCGQEVVYLREILRDFAIPQLDEIKTPPNPQNYEQSAPQKGHGQA